MKKVGKQSGQNGFTMVETLLVVLVLIVIGFGGYYVYYTQHNKTKPIATVTTTKSTTTSSSGSSSTPPTTTTNSYAVLAPATVASKTAECNQTVTTGQDGNPAPVTCSNGDLNTAEWTALEGIYPASVMTLGYNATQQQITNAVCADVNSKKTTLPIEGSAYQIAALYYGWTYQSDLVVKAGC